jgi:phage portal protein BeeE
MMSLQRVRGELVYDYTLPDGGNKLFARERILHLRGLGGNGLVGYSPVGLHRQAIGLGLAAEEFGARFFNNDATPGGILEHPGEMG